MAPWGHLQVQSSENEVRDCFVPTTWDKLSCDTELSRIQQNKTTAAWSLTSAEDFFLWEEGKDRPEAFTEST